MLKATHVQKSCGRFEVRITKTFVRSETFVRPEGQQNVINT